MLLSKPMGADYVVISFNMEVQPLVIHNAVLSLCVSAICIDVVYAMSAVGMDVVSSVHKLFAYRVVSTVSTGM